MVKRDTNRAILDKEQLLKDLRAMPLHLRRTQKAMAKFIGVSTWTINSLVKEERLAARSSFLKPQLNEEQKLARMLWIAGQVVEPHQATRRFESFYDRIFIDEKWFYKEPNRKRYYLLPQEEIPHRPTPNKKHVDKILFLVAVARPRTLPNGTYWDGKIGAWSFSEMVAAKRNSRNRPAGALELKGVSATREAFREIFINFLLPAIVALCPVEMLNKPIYIQQDNATPHLVAGDEEWEEAVEAIGQGQLQIFIDNQPAKSPDLNILDLGYFAAMQARQWALSPANNLLQLRDQVPQVFQDMPTDLLARVVLTMLHTMKAIVLDVGGNDYKLPHCNKYGSLLHQGAYPDTIQAPMTITSFI